MDEKATIEINTIAEMAVYKTDEDLLRYIKCYVPEKYISNVDKYWPAVSRAADAQGIPRSLLACVILQESTFDPYAKGPCLKTKKEKKMVDGKEVSVDAKDKNGYPICLSRAEGLAQILPSTMGDICRKHIKSDDYKDGWANSFADKNALPCNTSGTKDPELAIPAAALYLNQIENMVLNELERRSKRKGIPFARPEANALVRQLIAAGAYNVGPGKYPDVWSKPIPINQSDIAGENFMRHVNKHLTYTETKKYTDAAFGCMSNGVWTHTLKSRNSQCTLSQDNL